MAFMCDERQRRVRHRLWAILRVEGTRGYLAFLSKDRKDEIAS